jgi:hypothetical protein
MFGQATLSMTRRGFSIALLAAMLAALVPASASAAPKGYVASWACDDGHRYDLNFGAPPNQSSNLFVDGTNSMFVIRTLTIHDSGELVYQFDRGLSGFADKALTTCSTSIDTDVFTVSGYFTPRNR